MRFALALVAAAVFMSLSGCCWLVSDSIDGMVTPVCIWNLWGI